MYYNKNDILISLIKYEIGKIHEKFEILKTNIYGVYNENNSYYKYRNYELTIHINEGNIVPLIRVKKIIDFIFHFDKKAMLNLAENFCIRFSLYEEISKDYYINLTEELFGDWHFEY